METKDFKNLKREAIIQRVRDAYALHFLHYWEMKELQGHKPIVSDELVKKDPEFVKSLYYTNYTGNFGLMPRRGCNIEDIMKKNLFSKTQKK